MAFLVGVLAVVVFVTASCSRDPKAVKARAVESGDRYVAAGKTAEAIVEYRNAIQADPRDGELRLKLADLYSKTGNLALAAGEFVGAADILLDRPDVQVKAGNLLLLGGRFDDAKVRAEKGLAVAPRDVESQILLANALAGLKDLSAAVAEIEEAIRLQPDRSATYANLGVFELNRGHNDAAERAFTKATELDPRSAPALLALANFYWVTGRPKNVEAALLRAVTIQPDNLLVLRAMAGFAMTQNKPADAEQHLKKILDISKSPEAAVALADFYISRKNEASARDLLQPLTASTSARTGSMASVRLAALDHAAGRRDDAYRRLDQVLATNSTDLQALLVKSTMLLDEGRRDEALAPAERAVETHADSTAAFFTLGRVQAARNQTDAAIAAFKEALRLNPRATGAQIALARLHLATGHSAESVSFAEDAIRSDPGNADARLALARGLIARGDLARAETELGRLTAAYPRSAAVKVQNGVLLARRNNLTAARAAFEQALKLEPESAEALGGLVALDLGAKQPAAARDRVSERIKSPEASTAVLMLGARTYASTGDGQTAEQLLRRVLQKDASYLPAYAALGQLYVRQGRLDAALSEFDAMAERDPKPVAALTLAGIILEAQGKTQEARARFERVLQINPSAPVAANNLAWIYVESGANLDLALQLAQTAQRGLPESPEVSNTLGLIYYKKNLLSLAIPALKASADRDPNNALYLHHLGLAYAKNGDNARARDALERALRLKPDFDGAQEARSVLASLRGPD